MTARRTKSSNEGQSSDDEDIADQYDYKRQDADSDEGHPRSNVQLEVVQTSARPEGMGVWDPLASTCPKHVTVLADGQQTEDAARDDRIARHTDPSLHSFMTRRHTDPALFERETDGDQPVSAERH
jgi:hypothetical protein